MDYEKKYKELMAKMSTFLAKHDGLTISKYSKMYKELSEIFPELKESEGERIWIINYLNNRILNSTIIAEKENLKKAIAWLEKQGGQKPAEWRQDNVEELTEFENAMMHIGGSFFGKNAGLDPNDTACIKEQANLLLELVPSKGWSEEDDSKLKEVLYYIEYVNKTNVTFQQKDLAHLIKWLKFLKDRVQPQPRQNWSEEDEKNLNAALSYIKDEALKAFVKNRTQPKSVWSEEDKMQLDAAIHIVANSGHTCTSDWLKALKERVQLQNGYNPYKEVVESIAEMCKHYDTASHSGLRDFYDNVRVKCKDAKEYDSLYLQNTWKPSGPQIECLSDAIKHYNSQGYTAPVLKELLEQLKKIREE